MDGEGMSEELRECLRLLDAAPFFFWVCPKGCRGKVEWHDQADGGATAECKVCGAVSGHYPPRK